MISSFVVGLVLLTTTVSSPSARIKEIRQENIQERKELREQTREEFKEKLEAIQDERKQAVVEKLATRFETNNDKWTLHWTNVLTRLTQILDKAKEKFGETEELTEAYASVASAQAIVDTQAAIEYTIEFDDEATLGANIKKLVSEFRADLKETLDAVKEARNSVKEAIKSLNEEE